MKTVKIKFGHDFPRKDSEYLVNLLSQRFNVEISKEEYEYFFATETSIYYNPANIYELLNLDKKAIRICYIGEAVEPDFNLFDYTMGYSTLQYDDRCLCLPNFEKNRLWYVPNIKEFNGNKINSRERERAIE